MDNSDPSIFIEYLSGNCPVQSEGAIDGKPFYFRARGSHWSIGIGGEPIMSPDWCYVEDYGDDKYSAGWMSQYEALAFIAKAVELYAKGEPSQ